MITSISTGGRPLSRRGLLMAGLAGTLGCALPSAGKATAGIVLPGTGARRFSVLYGSTRIGGHTVSYASETGETRIETEIHLLVKVGPFTVYTFSHRSTETWRDALLASLKSRTVEQDETLDVEGAATPLGFRVASKGGPFIASAATLTSNSLWTPAIVEQTTLVDAQHGGVIGVSARGLGDETVMVGGRPVRAARYRFITPYYAGSIWYDADGLWVHGEFERDGAKIQYRLESQGPA